MRFKCALLFFALPVIVMADQATLKSNITQLKHRLFSRLEELHSQILAEAKSIKSLTEEIVSVAKEANQANSKKDGVFTNLLDRFPLLNYLAFFNLVLTENRRDGLPVYIDDSAVMGRNIQNALNVFVAMHPSNCFNVQKNQFFKNRPHCSDDIVGPLDRLVGFDGNAFFVSLIQDDLSERKEAFDSYESYVNIDKLVDGVESWIQSHSPPQSRVAREFLSTFSLLKIAIDGGQRISEPRCLSRPPSWSDYDTENAETCLILPTDETLIRLEALKQKSSQCYEDINRNLKSKRSLCEPIVSIRCSGFTSVRGKLIRNYRFFHPEYGRCITRSQTLGDLKREIAEESSAGTLSEADALLYDETIQSYAFCSRAAKAGYDWPPLPSRECK